MNIRERCEENEYKNLSAFAVKSRESKGRKRNEPECSIRTLFQRDRDRILHSKAFRRLMNKTQVFIFPKDDHCRNRLTHTLEVSQISRTISGALRLNSDLTEAIALGHDLGHTPFGHTGEDALNSIISNGFHHNEQSLRICEKFERSGGLNLTVEVLDGILNHRGSGTPATLEGKVVQISDKIAYINHDVDDSIREGILTENDLPEECTEILGYTKSQRINTLVGDIIENSLNKSDIIQTPKIAAAMTNLRAFLFDKVFLGNALMADREKYGKILTDIFEYYQSHFDEIPAEFMALYNDGDSKEIVICDYIAGMTDRYAITLYNSLF